MRDDEREETYSERIINSYLEFLPAKSVDEREDVNDICYM